jgi:hypothetical protein
MSESFPADRFPVPMGELPYNGLQLVAEPVRSVAAMPLEPSAEQARAVRGALSFLAALLEFYGEMIERDVLADAEPSHSEVSGVR